MGTGVSGQLAWLGVLGRISVKWIVRYLFFVLQHKTSALGVQQNFSIGIGSHVQHWESMCRVIFDLLSTVGAWSSQALCFYVCVCPCFELV